MATALRLASGGDELERLEALIDAGRPEAALEAAARRLRRPGRSADEEARLRLVRSLALWLAGAPTARVELQKAAGLARSPEARAGVAQTQALMSWRVMDVDAAWQQLERAPAVGGVTALRRLWLEAGLLKDEGKLTAALARLDAAIEAASHETQPGWRSRLLAERAGLHATLGRWGEARRDARLAQAGFAALRDPREATSAGLALAAIDLALGDLAAARAGVEKARGVARALRADPRALAEALLLASDLQLAAAAPAEAAEAASEALALFALARDRRGRCLAHVRHAHALVSCGRVGDALLEARRACRAGNDSRTQLHAWAELALGRVLLRVARADAARPFERAKARAGERADLLHLAELGAALARGEAREAPGLREALDGLTAWGDRRILSFGVADLRDLLTAPAAQAEAGATARVVVSVPGASENAIVGAAVALAQPGGWPARWSAAMRAVRPAAPWAYAGLGGVAGLELGIDIEAPRVVGTEGLLSGLRGRLGVPGVLAQDDPLWSEHPTRLLLGLQSAALAPLPDDAALCLAFRDAGAAERHLGLTLALGRLIAAQRPGVPAPPAEEAPGQPFPEIVGRCEAMRALFEQMLRVAASEAFVHVAGETGTGKGRVAQALHRRSRRRGGRFVAVNAASLSDELFEAEMFGHARGAFTGAIMAREGYVAEAEGGTLFLDEVADLSARAQAKLLRFLQDREYRRLGETELRRANVRVITAANVPLEERAAKGQFREDLLYRIGVVTLRLPPLRERRDDVLLLARHFLRAAALRDGRPVPELPRAVAARLVAHSWPGNVRELENQMTRMVALAGEGPLGPELLTLRAPEAAAARTTRLREALLGFERDYLRTALASNSGNRARTARELGITRQALLGKMSRLGVA